MKRLLVVSGVLPRRGVLIPCLLISQFSNYDKRPVSAPRTGAAQETWSLHRPPKARLRLVGFAWQYCEFYCLDLEEGDSIKISWAVGHTVA
jgi:hypothetical protein